MVVMLLVGLLLLVVVMGGGGLGGTADRPGAGTLEGESWRGGGMCTERPPPVRVALTERKALVASAAKTSLTNCTVSRSEGQHHDR